MPVAQVQMVNDLILT